MSVPGHQFGSILVLALNDVDDLVPVVVGNMVALNVPLLMLVAMVRLQTDETLCNDDNKDEDDDINNDNNYANDADDINANNDNNGGNDIIMITTLILKITVNNNGDINIIEASNAANNNDTNNDANDNIMVIMVILISVKLLFLMKCR